MYFVVLLTTCLWVSGHAYDILDELEPEIPKGNNLEQGRFQSCPEVLHTTLSVLGEKITLKLVLNPNVNLDVPVFISVDGNSSEWQSEKASDEPCYYHDLDYNAAFSVRHRSDFSEMTGTLQTSKGTFKVTPVSHAQRRLRRALGRHKSHDHKVELISTQGLSSLHSQHRRERRAAKEAYVVQIDVVVDYLIYERWYSASKKTTSFGKKYDAVNNIKYYFAHIINDVAIRYRSITTADFAIEIVLSGYHIATNPQSVAWTQQVHFMDDPEGGPRLADSTTLLDAFSTWVNSPGAGLPEFDHAMLFTGYNMFSIRESGSRRVANPDTIGRATVGHICRFDRTSVNEDNGQFQTTVPAHELAHNLGAGHDGENGCSAEDQYIMTPNVENTPKKNETYKNEYLFSPCSQAEMKDTIHGLIRNGRNCLNNQATPVSGWADMMTKMPGQKYDLEKQCIHVFGEGSYFCGGNDHATEVCQNLLCYNPAKDGCYHTYLEAMPGTSCGDKKWCFKGDCVESDNAPKVNPECVFGDYPGRFKLGNSTSTCEEMLSGKTHRCYSKGNRNLCCATCQSRLKNIDGCEYGDKATWCKDLTSHECYRNDATCCETCLNFQTDTTIPDCKYGDRSSQCFGISGAACYFNGHLCCGSCNTYITGIPDCKYGDKSSRCRLHHCSNPLNHGVCCQTCHESNAP